MKTKQALDALDRAIALIGTEQPRRENEFTVNEYAERAGISAPHAAGVLRQKVADGLLVMRKSRVNGRSTNMYSLAE
jgi:predicted ArsR family transcriptional regulator